MSGKELKKLHVIRQILEKKIRQVKGGEILSMCVRQIRRLIRRVKDEGDKGIIHRSRGRDSKRRLGEEIRAKVIDKCRGRYDGFGPTLVSEKLLEEEKIEISQETVRKWMREEG